MAGYGAGAGIAALVSVGFFSGAGFLWLRDQWGAIAAALTFGGIYFVIAIILALLAAARRPLEPEPIPPTEIWTSLAEAFLIGLSAFRRKR